MKALYIIRHGAAGKRLEDESLDEARPLTKKGKDRMKDIAKGLKDMGVSFDKLITSPLPRCAETADILMKCSAEDPQATDLLKPGASSDDLIGYLNTLDGADAVAIVGHEPFLSEFASYCMSKSKTSFIVLKKGGIIAMDVDGMLKPGTCKLEWLMGPAQLEKI